VRDGVQKEIAAHKALRITAPDLKEMGNHYEIIAIPEPDGWRTP